MEMRRCSVALKAFAAVLSLCICFAHGFLGRSAQYSGTSANIAATNQYRDVFSQVRKNNNPFLLSRGGGSLSDTQPDASADVAVEGESFQFQAEVNRVMDIIINSLYSDRDVFVREIVSNAADACDKKRFLSIADGDSVTDLMAKSDLGIKVKADKEARTLTIEDSGVGMTKDELINNLGRIAQSGTAKFVEALGKGEADVSLIGQFGVGFYSSYLVADRVSVTTKSFVDGESAKQYRWVSEAGSEFRIIDDSANPDQIEGSGTRITLHLKDDCDEYLDDFRLRELIKRYSDFVPFPIDLWCERTTYEEVPDLDAPVEMETITNDDGTTVQVPKADAAPAMKTVPKTEQAWDLVNQQRPIWMRNPREVQNDEYAEFYKSTFRAYDDPAAHTHFSMEGQVEFRALLFVPSVLPFELSRDMFSDDSKAVRLYVKRVFINDKFENLLPRFLTFLRGVVDSEDLPLNVGREILQKSKMLNIINKRLVRKSLDMFRELKQPVSEEELAEQDPKAAARKDRGQGTGARGPKWRKFWSNFGRYLKVGVIEDIDYKRDLAPLLQFFTSYEGNELTLDGMTDLDGYIARMKPNQTYIYYLTADSKEAAAKAPALEGLRRKGYEVLYLTEALDEFCVQSLEEYDGKPLMDAAKGGMDLGDMDDEDRKRKEEKSEEYETLTQWLQSKLVGKVQKVEVSARLTDSPCALVQGAYGMSPTMQRYMRAQSVLTGQEGKEEEEDGMGGLGNLAGMGNMGMGSSADPSSVLNQAIMEVNPDHPIVRRLKQMVDADPDGAETVDYGQLLYDVAAVSGGYNIENVSDFAGRITALMRNVAGADMPETFHVGRGGDGDGEEGGGKGGKGEAIDAEVV